jgi:hypothetical protein
LNYKEEKFVNYFEDLDIIGYEKYLKENPFYLDLKEVFPNDFDKKVQGTYENVDTNIMTPFPAEFDDLVRLHYLITKRKVTTIMEFGIGKSTVVFNHALEANKNNFGDFVFSNLRRTSPFECYSIDNNTYWINKFKEEYGSLANVNIHHSEVRMSMVANRVCTLYDTIPNISPDFIYLDAPNQFTVLGEVNGIHSRDADRFPMSADILLIEYYLLPGTLIVVDGRTANARFLRNNLQRNWQYTWIKEYDQHFFELIEEPLGVYNKKHNDFVLDK